MFGCRASRAIAPTSTTRSRSRRPCSRAESRRALTRKLVKDQGVAQDVNVGTEDHRGPDAFVIDAKLSEKGKIDDVEKAIWAEIDDLAKKGPTKAEMEKARAKIEHSFLFGLQANLSRAMELAKFEGHHGDASKLRARSTSTSRSRPSRCRRPSPSTSCATRSRTCACSRPPDKAKEKPGKKPKDKKQPEKADKKGAK